MWIEIPYFVLQEIYLFCFALLLKIFFLKNGWFFFCKTWSFKLLLRMASSPSERKWRMKNFQQLHKKPGIVRRACRNCCSRIRAAIWLRSNSKGTYSLIKRQWSHSKPLVMSDGRIWIFLYSGTKYVVVMHSLSLSCLFMQSHCQQWHTKIIWYPGPRNVWHPISVIVLTWNDE